MFIYLITSKVRQLERINALSKYRIKNKPRTHSLGSAPSPKTNSLNSFPHFSARLSSPSITASNSSRFLPSPCALETLRFFRERRFPLRNLNPTQQLYGLKTVDNVLIEDSLFFRFR